MVDTGARQAGSTLGLHVLAAAAPSRPGAAASIIPDLACDEESIGPCWWAITPRNLAERQSLPSQQGTGHVWSACRHATLRSRQQSWHLGGQQQGASSGNNAGQHERHDEENMLQLASTPKVRCCPCPDQAVQAGTRAAGGRGAGVGQGLPGLRGPGLQRPGSAGRDPEHHAPQPHWREAGHLDGGAPGPPALRQGWNSEVWGRCGVRVWQVAALWWLEGGVLRCPCTLTAVHVQAGLHEWS